MNGLYPHGHFNGQEIHWDGKKYVPGRACNSAPMPQLPPQIRTRSNPTTSRGRRRRSSAGVVLTATAATAAFAGAGYAFRQAFPDVPAAINNATSEVAGSDPERSTGKLRAWTFVGKQHNAKIYVGLTTDSEGKLVLTPGVQKGKSGVYPWRPTEGSTALIYFTFGENNRNNSAVLPETIRGQARLVLSDGKISKTVASLKLTDDGVQIDRATERATIRWSDLSGREGSTRGQKPKAFGDLSPTAPNATTSAVYAGGITL